MQSNLSPLVFVCVTMTLQTSLQKFTTMSLQTQTTSLVELVNLFSEN